MSRRVVLFRLLLAMIIGVSGAPLSAQENYPEGPIKLVVPFGAGGGTDTYARMIKKAIDEQNLLPNGLVIINRGGAGATIGSRHVKNAEPDGYTMMILHEAILTAKYAGNAEYGAEAFEPVAGTGEVGMVIVVPAKSPYKTVDDLLTDIAQRPNTVTFGANMGALTHYAGLWLEEARDDGGRFRFVQSGGGADRLAGLLGGHIDITGFSIEEYSRFKSDKIRGLVYFGEERHSSSPEIPTAIEEGYPISNTVMYYWWVPKGTPQPKIDYLANVLETVFKSEDVAEQLDELQVTPIFLKGEALKERLRKRDRQIAKTEVREQTSVPDFTFVLLPLLGGLVVLFGVMKFHERRTTPTTVSLTEPPAPVDPPPNYRIKPKLAVAALVLTCLYAGFLSTPWSHFVIATTIFVALLGPLLRQKLDAPGSIGFLAMGFMLAFSLQYLFTQVFEIDLP